MAAMPRHTETPCGRSWAEPEPGPHRVGWVCSYTPEELLIAAGFLPCRMPTWEAEGQQSDAVLAPTVCPYVHRIYQVGLRWASQDGPGMVLTSSCDSMRRLADACEAHLRPRFVYRLDVPRRSDSAAEGFFRSRLAQLLEFLEAAAGRRIAEADLEEAIALVDRTRELITALAGLRSRCPGIVGAREVQAACRAAVTRDKRQVNQELAEQLAVLQAEAEQLGREGGDRPRLLVWGCPVEDMDLLAQLEEAGAWAVADDLCTGSRHFQGRVGDSGEPLERLARRYLQRRPCSRMTGAQARLESIKALAREHGCDGVLCHTLKFCDPTQSDVPRLRRTLEAAGLPVLHLERQGLAEDAGQLRTRIEAFVEMLTRTRPSARRAVGE